MKSLLIISFLTLLFWSLYGQEKPHEKLHQAIGWAVGSSTGYGLSYLASYKKAEVQITFCPYKNNNESYYSRYREQIITGLSFIYTLTKNKNINLIAYQGNHWFYEYEEYEYHNGVRITTRNFTNHGLGIGLDFKFLQKGIFHLMGGYAWYGETNGLNISGETGLFYNFR